MMTNNQRGNGWTVVLRRQPAYVHAGRPEGGYTNSFEVLCFDCGDDPCRDYQDVSPRLQQIRGPYPLAEGVVAYEQHLGWHKQQHMPPVGGNPGCLADRR